MRDERSLEQKLEAMLTVALEPITTEELADVVETLAIIAYRQPVSRAQITALRGVNVDGVVRLLEQRGYIEEKGRAPGPGLPILYGTTELFLDRMGLAAIRDLPPIEEFMPPVETAQELADELFESSLELSEDA